MVYICRHDRDCKEVTWFISVDMTDCTVTWFIPVDIRQRLHGVNMIYTCRHDRDCKVTWFIPVDMTETAR